MTNTQIYTRDACFSRSARADAGWLCALEHHLSAPLQVA
jgi:hypothetical protein